MATTTAYLRVSTDKQTLENQRCEIERFTKKKGITVDRWVEEVVSVHHALTSRNRKMPVAIYDRIQAKAFGTVITKPGSSLIANIGAWLQLDLQGNINRENLLSG